MKQTILITAIIVLLSISCVSAATVSHTASQILPGIFQAGTYNFPGVLTVGTTLYVNDSSGRVGIGTTSPDGILTIEKAALLDVNLRTTSDDLVRFRVLGNNGATEIRLIAGRSTDAGAIRANTTAIQTFTDTDMDFMTNNTARMTIDSTGNIGIGTTEPEGELHIKSDQPALLLESLLYKWKIRTNDNKDELHFLVNDNSRLMIKDGNVGIGTTMPYSILSIGSSDATAFITPGGANTHLSLQTTGTGGAIRFFTLGGSIGNVAPTESMRVDANGNVGIGTTNPVGKLDVNGAIYQRGGLLHADYVFEDDYELESIEEHSDYMWENKHLPAVPKAIKDDSGQDIVDIGQQRRGMLEELEKAHVYIEQLDGAVKQLKSENDALKQLVCLDHPTADVCS